MSAKNIRIAISVLAILLIAFILVIFLTKDNKRNSSQALKEKPGVQKSKQKTENDSQIIVDYPKPGDVVTDPVIIKGKARGSWFFEANFPIKLIDGKDFEISKAVATADGEWMTEDFVPFTAEISFIDPDTDRGTLILEKENPSGLPENDDSISIPVIFQKSNSRAILLYYYNKQKDPDSSCTSDAVLPVKRKVQSSQTPIQDALSLLLKNDLTPNETYNGFVSEFPLSGLELKGANLKNGVLTLEFKDPQNKTGGGSCKVTILRSQIEKTAKQFPGVKEVRIIPEELFQP